MSQVVVKCPAAVADVCFSPTLTNSPFTGDAHCLLVLSDGTFAVANVAYRPTPLASLSSVAVIPDGGVIGVSLDRSACCTMSCC